MTLPKSPEGRPHYNGLDGLRGIAALFVAAMHLSIMWGRPLFTGAYLAVDFFFILSGFVIAAAYADRLAAEMTAWEFAKRRVIRLWPLFILGLAIGAAYQIPRALSGLFEVHGPAAILSAALGVFMLPSPVGLGGHGWLYPINVPAWSLFFELIANFAYGVLAPRITTGRLVVFVGLAGAILCGVAARFGTLNLGSDAATFWGGLARVAFGFSAGILIHRFHRAKQLRANGWMLAAAALLVAALIGRPSSWLGDVLIAVAAFPVLIMAGSWCNPQGDATSVIAKALGRASYPLYALHSPLIWWLGFALNRVGVPLTSAVDQLAALAFVAVFALAADHWWDIPIRRALTHRFARTHPRPALLAASNGQTGQTGAVVDSF